MFECAGSSSAQSIQLSLFPVFFKDSFLDLTKFFIFQNVSVIKAVDATKCLNEGTFADNSQSHSIFMNQTCHCQYGSYGRWCENRNFDFNTILRKNYSEHDSDVWVTVLVAVFVVFAGVVVLFLGYRRQVLPIRQNNKPVCSIHL